MEPERDPGHPVEVGVLLEGGDGHPEDGEHRNDDERRDARVDQQMAADRALPCHGAKPQSPGAVE